MHHVKHLLDKLLCLVNLLHLVELDDWMVHMVSSHQFDNLDNWPKHVHFVEIGNWNSHVASHYFVDLGICLNSVHFVEVNGYSNY